MRSGMFMNSSKTANAASCDDALAETEGCAGMSEAPTTWRLIRSSPANGVRNMATDLALVRLAEVPVLRLYSWSPPALSLGYHQKLEDIDREQCAELGIDIVRRPTGGRAILHAQELTYAVIVPSAHPWCRAEVVSVYEQISGALLQALRQLGVPAEMAAPSPQREKAYAGRVACFARSVRHEICVYGRKLVGSAQRRFRTGLLQHGSILTGPAHERLEELLRIQSGSAAGVKQAAISLQEVLGDSPELPLLEDAVVEGFKRFFQITFVESTLTQAEAKQCEQEARSLQESLGARGSYLTRSQDRVL